MGDDELRGLVLDAIYQRRRDGLINFDSLTFPPLVLARDRERIAPLCRVSLIHLRSFVEPHSGAEARFFQSCKGAFVSRPRRSPTGTTAIAVLTVLGAC
jgi:hypothetical protein